MDPVIDYTDKDFRSLRQAMLDLAAYRLPEWTDRSPTDLGVLLVDLFAYMGDILSYYQDRIAAESFLDTAVERRSVINLLRLVGYELASPAPASAELTLTFTAPAPGRPTTVTVPTGARFGTAAAPGGGEPPVFEYLDEPLTVDLAAGLTVTGLPVRQVRTIREEILGSATDEPGQRFRLAAPAPVPDSISVTVDEGAGPVGWNRRENLLYHRGPDGRITLSGPESTDYYVQYDEEDRAEVVFGDRLYGRPPRSGRDNVRASYAVTLGARGNVPAGTITRALTEIPGLAAVGNPRPAAGGADAEPIERAVRSGPLAFRSGDRAVTLGDYVTLALRAGGVAKVRARSSGWNRVDLVVAPEGEECAPSSAQLKKDLLGYFDDRRMVGTSIRIVDPVCVPVDITVEVVPEHNHLPQTVRQQAERAVRGLLAFRAVEFGRPLYLSKVYEAVEALPGVAAATVTRFRRVDAGPPVTLRRKVLADAGLADVGDFIDRVYGGAVAVEGRIGIGETELPVPGTITVTLRSETS
ncbi:hypothetical protein GCM10010156_40760 [Planobispora rosea]|uniref:Baseplate protein J-like barrel domain-containing protein n=1 Tax=Planobispora rosea TaxID=35762 RepID=A0A8J3S4A5_PLARO|nr:baseplate J/gp47 family protein [Planobispora rosea]GGS77819.1 hypothetical protein GCM10010156_40760 [Planobispora rosea]GIH85602.1 hypothetical protein Pro02_40100 [Planobispora rosea]